MSDFTRVPSGCRGVAAPLLPHRVSPPDGETHLSLPDRAESSDTDPPPGLVVPIEEATGRPYVVSLSGREFDPMSSTWVLSKDVSLNLDLVLSRLAPEFSEPYRRVLQFYAEEYSPAYCAGIHQGITKLLADTGVDAFSVSTLRAYRASLGAATEWRLGTIRAFLITWHDQGRPGVSDDVVEFLQSITIKGNAKGGPVLSLDPDCGPFDDQEVDAILAVVAERYERGAVALDTLAFTMLLAYTGRRPGQLTQLRLVDFFEGTIPDGRRIDGLHIPRAKQRGCAPRTRFTSFWLDPELHRVLAAQRAAVIDNAARFGALSDELLNEFPLFPNWGALARIHSQGALRVALGNDSLHVTTDDVRDGLAQLHVVSARTGRRLHITPRRFRYTLGTRAHRAGYGAFVIAQLLDHSDIQHVWVYQRPHANFRQHVDRAVGNQLDDVANAFLERFVDSEAQARQGHNPGMRVGCRETKTGSCGDEGFCGAQAYACYTCVQFQPWLDGPHERVLEWFLRERERAEEAGASPQVVASTDRSIAAARAVIAACEARRAEIEEGSS